MANNINALRVAFLLDAQEFARLIGIYPDYIRRLESGDRPLTELWIDAVARTLHVGAEAVTQPGAPIDADALKAPRSPPALCPLAARYAILSLIARLGGLRIAESLDEDEIADAVQSLVSFVEEDRLERGGGMDASRLSKGLQITVLTILQSRAPALPAGFEEMLERLAPGAVSLLEAYSAVVAPVRVWES